MENLNLEIVSNTLITSIIKHKSKKWDNLIEDYHNYMKEYIKHYKKPIQWQ